MSASKRPKEKRLSLTKLLNLSCPRNKWLGALREEILNSNIKTRDFRIAIFIISIVIYGYVFSALTSWLPSSITGNFIFFLFELVLIYILGIKTFGILKRWAEADKKSEREVLAEGIQQVQHNGISQRTVANSFFFDHNRSNKTYPQWIRKLYSYFFTTEEKTTHYVLIALFMFLLLFVER